MHLPRSLQSLPDPVLLIAALLISWLGWIVWPLLWPGELLASGLLIARRSRLAKWALLFSFCTLTPLASFGTGLSDYYNGTAYRISRSALFSSQAVLDPRLRCYLKAPTRRFWPAQNFWLIPRSLACEVGYRLIGPMPGTYHGKLPTRSQAARRLALAGEELSLAEFEQLQYEIEGKPRNFTLAKQAIRYGLAHDTSYAAFTGLELLEHEVDSNTRLRIARIEDNCLVVGHAPIGYRSDQKQVLVDVIDLQGDSLVARFW